MARSEVAAIEVLMRSLSSATFCDMSPTALVSAAAMPATEEPVVSVIWAINRLSTPDSSSICDLPKASWSDVVVRAKATTSVSASCVARDWAAHLLKQSRRAGQRPSQFAELAFGTARERL